MFVERVSIVVDISVGVVQGSTRISLDVSSYIGAGEGVSVGSMYMR